MTEDGDDMDARRVLFVTYEFPPRGGPGVQRPLKLTKYLPDAGWVPTVLTVRDPVTAIRDETLLAEVPESVEIVRAWSLEPNRVVRLFRTLTGQPEAGTNGATATSLTRLAPSQVRKIQRWFVPDEKRFWKPFAMRHVARLAKRLHFDAVISSGPPNTAHLVGLDASRRLGVPFIADFRDPWVGGLLFDPPTRLHRQLHLRQEAAVIRGAAAVVTVTARDSNSFAERYGDGHKFVTIANGFDPADLPNRRPAPHARTRIAHVGTLGPFRSPEPFLRGLYEAESRDRHLSQEVELTFVGSGREVEAMAGEIGIDTPVRCTGYVDHATALRELADADVALLILSPGLESEVTLAAKVFEYLGLRKPILAVAGEGEVRRVLRGQAGIWFADPESVGEIADAILGMVVSARLGGLERPHEEFVAQFDRRKQAARYAELLDSVVSEHA